MRGQLEKKSSQKPESHLSKTADTGNPGVESQNKLAAAQAQENDFFNKHYNKELRVSKEEIPMVLAELNESSIAFIKKEQYERALNLL